MIQRLLARIGLLLVGAMLAGCAAGTVTTSAGAALRRSAQASDRRAEAYYGYTVAQMAAQAGRLNDAVPALRDALKRDPNSAHLWMTLAQWLVRLDAADEALNAARRAVELSPDDAATHTTLAELLRAQKKWAEAEAELEKVIALNPDAEEPYLTLARYQVEQKAYDRAHGVLLRLIEKSPRLARSEEHTSELQSQSNLVCRLLLEKKKKKDGTDMINRNT